MDSNSGIKNILEYVLVCRVADKFYALFVLSYLRDIFVDCNMRNGTRCVKRRKFCF